jgi:hypothetical protein
MKIKHSSHFASIVIAGILASSALSAAPRSTPVTVVNDAASPVPVTVQSSDTPQFAGFTTATFDGSQGVVTYFNACNQDYAGSHMCTSEEFLNSKTFPATSGDGWIRPTFVPTSFTGEEGVRTHQNVLDMSGVSDSSPGSLTCRGWSSPIDSYLGLKVDSSGRFKGRGCDEIRAVACCM